MAPGWCQDSSVVSKNVFAQVSPQYRGWLRPHNFHYVYSKSIKEKLLSQTQEYRFLGKPKDIQQ